MKKLLILLSLCFAAGSAFALPIFDPFADASGSGGTSYAVGANLIGQNNSTLASPWYSRGIASGSIIQPTIATGNLIYSNMPPSLGNSVSFVRGSNQSACVDMTLAVGHTAAVYTSFLLKITDLSAVPTFPTNNPIAAYGDDPAPQNGSIGRLGSRLLTKKVGSGYVLGTSRSANTADFIYEPDASAHSVGEVVLVVMSYYRPTTAQPDINLWINPPFSSLGSNQPPAPTISATSGTTALNGNNARAFGVLGQFPGAPEGIIDDVRIATNDWSFVTGGDPAILTNPTNRNVAQNGSTSFSITARGTPTLSYQWVKDGTTILNDGGHISGSRSNVLTVSNVGAGDLGTYSAFVTNGLNVFAQSASATLSLLTDPTITNQPQTFAGNFGTTATFQVVAGGTQPVSYFWQKDGFGVLNDGGNILGSHSNVLAISSIACADAGTYFVTVSNSQGVVDSAHVALIVADPYITQNPVAVTTNAGGTASFHVAGAGSPTLSYQWLKNGNLIFNNAPYSGADTDTLIITNVSSAEQANYSALVIGPCSNAVSAAVALNVLTPVSVAIPPRPRAVKAGAKTAFVVVAGGSGPFSYRWQRNGSDVSGATDSAYIVTNAQPALAGDYRVVISNSFSAVTSIVASLTVSNTVSLVESNLVIVRVGDGANALTINGSAMFLDQFDVNGNYVNTVTIPDDGTTAMAAIGWDNINGVNNGSTTGTSLTRSRDGRFMVIAGYNTNLNYGASLMASSATNVAKAIGLIDSFGDYTMPVRSTNTIFDNSFWRAAITDGTNNYWGSAGVAGTYYFGFDGSPGIIQSTFVNARSMGLFNGDIYCAEASNPTGVLKINGMPTTNVTPTVLFSGASGSYDIAVNPAGDVIYLTDQRNVANSGGIQRWEFNGSTWALAYTLNVGFGSLGPRYITADFSGANPVLYVTSNDQTFDNNRLIRVVDTGVGSTGTTTLAFAGANQTFRGIHFGPVPNTITPRPTISFSRSGNNLVLTWSGSFTLMSATNVAGPYVDVSGASSPYTNNVSEAQRFFGLRQ